MAIPRDHGREKLSPFIDGKLREFMLSDDLEDCGNKNVNKQEELDRIVKAYGYGKSNRLTYKMLWECMKVLDITLENLLAKFGMVMALDEEAEKVRKRLAELSEAGVSLVTFNTVVSRFTGDFFYYDEVVEGNRTRKFFFIKNRFLGKKDCARADSEIRKRCPEFDWKAQDRHFNSPLLTDELIVAAELWKLPVRWLLEMDDDVTAYLPDPEADKALMYFLMCHDTGRRQYVALMDRMFGKEGEK